MTAEQRRQSLLEYVQRAATLVSVDALPLDDAMPAAVITDASANVAMLCDALHRTLTHGLVAPSSTAMTATMLLMPWRTESSSSTASSSSSSTTSSWSALQTLGVAQLSASARDAVQFIAADVADDELRAAALVRWLLNERAMEPLMRHLFAHPKLSKLYDADALVRREDTQSVLSMIAASLSNLQFRLCVAASDHHALAAAPTIAAPAVKSTRPIAVRVGATVPAIDSEEPVVSIDADDSIIRRRRPVQTAANPAIVDSSPVGSIIDATAVVTPSSPPRVTSPPQAIVSSSSSSSSSSRAPKPVEDDDDIALTSTSLQSDHSIDVQLEESSFREPSILVAQFESSPKVTLPVSESMSEPISESISEPISEPVAEPAEPVVVEESTEVADVPAVDVVVPVLPSEIPIDAHVAPRDEMVVEESTAAAVVPDDAGASTTSITSTSTSTTSTKEFRLKKNKTKQGGFVFEVKR
jgi:hypothetical protein